MTSTGVDWRLVSVALAAAVPLIPAIWKLSGHKAETHSKWHERVSIMEAGLDELASEKLIVLQNEIDELLDSKGKFDPTKVVGDPAALKGPAKQYLRIVKKRKRVRLYFSAMLYVVQLLLFASVGLLFGIVAALLGYFECLTIAWIISASYWVGAVSAVVAVIGYAVYVTSQHLLGNAEVLVNEQLRDD